MGETELTLTGASSAPNVLNVLNDPNAWTTANVTSAETQAARNNVVIPAKAGIHFSAVRQDGFGGAELQSQTDENLDSRLRGNDDASSCGLRWQRACAHNLLKRARHDKP